MRDGQEQAAQHGLPWPNHAAGVIGTFVFSGPEKHPQFPAILYEETLACSSQRILASNDPNSIS
jgi:hypothetical protein